jgi:ABC-type multidrug transport system ATPase subunit
LFGLMELSVPALRMERLETGLIGPVSFEVAEGECVALMGASGSGKSLLLRAIVDLDKSSGTVTLGDLERGNMPASAWRKLVALVPAESGWWSDRVCDHFPREADAGYLLDALALTGALEWEVTRLSTGERQRLAIARAMCRNPKALLLDEPTASLDEAATRRVEDLVARLCRSGVAVLMVTHDRRQGARVASRVLHMADGRLEDGAGSIK